MGYMKKIGKMSKRKLSLRQLAQGANPMKRLRHFGHFDLTKKH